MAKRGYVYCLANDVTPNIVKIGATTTDPVYRLLDALSAKWTMPYFRIIAEVEVGDVFKTERSLHGMLAHRRVHGQREFFSLSEEEVRAFFHAITLVSEPDTQYLAPVQQERPVVIGDADKLRCWVESNYTHVPLNEKDYGTKLDTLYSAYATSADPVHSKMLGKTNFARMLKSIYTNIGPHKDTRSTCFLYLLK
jgi:hypothetical protein